MKIAAICVVLLLAAALAILPQPGARLAAAASPAQAAPHSVSLAWVASADTVTGYNVYRSTIAGNYGGAPLNGSAPVSGRSYTDSTVAPGTYFYVVRAVIVSGATQTESANSNEVTAVILPAPPTVLQITSKN